MAYNTQIQIQRVLHNCIMYEQHILKTTTQLTVVCFTECVCDCVCVSCFFLNSNKKKKKNMHKTKQYVAYLHNNTSKDNAKAVRIKEIQSIQVRVGTKFTG